jgi:hypothetical protein
VSRALGMVRLDGFPLRHRDDPWLRQLARSYQLSYLAAEVSTPPVASNHVKSYSELGNVRKGMSSFCPILPFQSVFGTTPQAEHILLALLCCAGYFHALWPVAYGWLLLYT